MRDVTKVAEKSKVMATSKTRRSTVDSTSHSGTLATKLDVSVKNEESNTTILDDGVDAKMSM